MKTNKRQLVFLALLSAVTFVLQMLAAVIPAVGQFRFSFAMVPVVVAAVSCGKKGGAIIGGVFGLTVFAQCLFGIDTGGAVLLQVNPFFTFVVSAVRGALAGLLVGIVADLLGKKTGRVLRYVITAASAPFFNTLLFVLGYSTLFRENLYEAAGGSNAFSFVILGLVGVNFLFELATTVLVSPAICTAVEKTEKH